jgi:Uma2 family endonuclease
MMVMIDLQQCTLTLDEFHAFCELPENRDHLFELIDGEIVKKMASFEPSNIAAEIIFQFKQWLMTNPIGRVTAPDGSYILSSEHEFTPDVGYISKARMPEKPLREVPMAPDLAVEVKSPTDSKPELRRKAKIYLEHGTQMVWLVFPDTQIVEVYVLGQDVVEVGIEGVLDGGAVLPGFTLAVQSLFADN